MPLGREKRPSTDTGVGSSIHGDLSVLIDEKLGNRGCEKAAGGVIGIGGNRGENEVFV